MHKIKFIQEDHTYANEEGQDLISVSKFTDRFKPKVDWNAIAKKQAIRLTKEGVPTTTEDILEKWANKRDISATVGTRFHDIKEQELLEETSPTFYDTVCNIEGSCYEEGYKTSTSIHEIKNNTVYPELMIYDFDHMICGQSDKVIIVNNKINIWDYKTDQKIEFKGWSSQWKDARMLLPPVDHLEECNGNIYSLKMSLYMYLLWKANKGRFKPGEIIIEHSHLKRDQDNDNIPFVMDGSPIVLKTEKLVLPYLKKEVMAMLKTLK